MPECDAERCDHQADGDEQQRCASPRSGADNRPMLPADCRQRQQSRAGLADQWYQQREQQHVDDAEDDVEGARGTSVSSVLVYLVMAPDVIATD